MKVTTDEHKAQTLQVVKHGRAVPIHSIQKAG
jgi:hypothetical protein